MNQTADDQTIERRFQTAFTSIAPNANHPSPKACIALSGGSDSISLLHLLRYNFPDTDITALTVNHNLRIEALTEAQKVGKWMEALGVTHHILTWQNDGVDGNVQAEARKARYQLMFNWCNSNNISTLLLGHTQDDQAETIAIMQERASGAVGLAGMSATRTENGITIMRPLLGHSRQELRDWLKAQNIEWVDDPSNKNTDFARIRIRNELAKDCKRKAELLELGRSMTAERIEIERAHENFVEQYVDIKANILSCPLTKLLELGQMQTAYTLGNIIRHIGGNDYPPRYAKRLRLIEALSQPDCKQTTLGNCFISVKNDSITFSLEKYNRPSRVKPLVPSPFRPIF